MNRSIALTARAHGRINQPSIEKVASLVLSGHPLGNTIVGAASTNDSEKIQFPEPTPFEYMASTAGTALGGYHGYKRNDSIGWGLLWAACGSFAPFLTTAIAVAQGYGQKAKKS